MSEYEEDTRVKCSSCGTERDLSDMISGVIVYSHDPPDMCYVIVCGKGHRASCLNTYSSNVIYLL